MLEDLIQDFRDAAKASRDKDAKLNHLQSSSDNLKMQDMVNSNEWLDELVRDKVDREVPALLVRAFEELGRLYSPPVGAVAAPLGDGLGRLVFRNYGVKSI